MSVFLFEIQAADTVLCCFCQGTLDSFDWDCPVTRAFWEINVKDFLVSVDLTEASGFLKKLNV